MNVELNCTVKGRFKLQTMKAGKVTRETGWFDNLITNQGMNQLTTSTNPLKYIQVGSGSAAPSFSDTALASYIAGRDAGSPVSTIDTTKHYFYATYTATFPAGSATGNISEIGAGTAVSGSVLSSRALVLDSGGSPTSITVLADEDLVAIYTFGIKQPTGDFTDTVGGRAITIRAAKISSIGTSDLSQGWDAANSSRAQFAVPNSSTTFSAHTGSIGSVTGYPAGTKAVGTNSNIANAAYVADSWTRSAVMTFGTNQANFAIKSFAWAFGPTLWQMELADAITKTSSQTFKLGVSLTWSRDSGPA